MNPECAPTTSHAMAEPAAAALAGVLKSLADPLRLRMLSAIATDARGEACVCDLEALADVSQPTISHHLRVMREAGVLQSERRGTWVYYRITPALHGAVTALLGSFSPSILTRAEIATPPLTDVDDRLTDLAQRLMLAHPTHSGDLVAHVVRESYASMLARSENTEAALNAAAVFAAQRLADIAHGSARTRTPRVPHVLFVCVANAGRSQLAAALINERAGGAIIARSAGSAPGAAIHPHVRALLDEISPGTVVFPKPLTDDAVRAADVVITMGCGDVCPILPGVHYEDWPVGDPALASDEGTAAIRDDIAARVDHLIARLTTGEQP